FGSESERKTRTLRVSHLTPQQQSLLSVRPLGDGNRRRQVAKPRADGRQHVDIRWMLAQQLAIAISERGLKFVEQAAERRQGCLLLGGRKFAAEQLHLVRGSFPTKRHQSAAFSLHQFAAKIGPPKLA